MNPTRRNILKGLVALGSVSALTLATPLATLSRSESNPIHLIVANDNIGQAFYKGANTAPSVMIQSALHSEATLPFLRKCQNLFENKGQRIVGLVDDASAVLVLDLVRTSNARIIWQKDHIIHSNESAEQLGLAAASHTFSSSMVNQATFKKHYVSFLIES